MKTPLERAEFAWAYYQQMQKTSDDQKGDFITACTQVIVEALAEEEHAKAITV